MFSLFFCSTDHNKTVCFLDKFLQKMSEESDDELPANWQAGKTNDGRVFYVNHQTQNTQWEHPVTNQVKVISKGKFFLENTL
jgi:hypothetical protein